MTKNNFIILTLAFSFVTGIFVFQTFSKENVKFCRPNNMVSALSYIADVKGYYKDQGLDLAFQEASNAKICVDQINAGKSDIFMGGEGPPTYAGFQPTKFKIIAETSVIPETALFIRNDRGIKSEQDLRGKKIAYLPGTVSFLYLARLVDKYDIPMTEVDLVAMQAPTMPQALVGGVIDGFVMWEPWGQNALEQLKDNATRLFNKDIYVYRGIIGVSDKFLMQKEINKKLMKAHFKAEEFIKNNPEEAQSILSEATKLDYKFLKDSWDDYQFHINLKVSLVDLMGQNAKYIIQFDENFKNKDQPDFNKMMDKSILLNSDSARVVTDTKIK
jgi:NitT/TauT family transport system substrate-binding protein